MLYVLLLCIRKNENVIIVNKQELVQQDVEHIIDKCLEHCRGVGQAKRHDKVLEMS